MPDYKMTPEEWQTNYLNSDWTFTTATQDEVRTRADWIAIQDTFSKVQLIKRDGYVIWYDELTGDSFSKTTEESNEPKGWETL